MNSKILVSFFLLANLFCEIGSSYESVVTPGGNQNPDGTMMGSGTTMSAKEGVEVGRATAEGVKGINEAGNKTSTKQVVSSGINIGVGGTLAFFGCPKSISCTVDCPMWIVMCVTGVATLGQGSLQMETAVGSGNTAKAASFSGAPGYQGNPYQIDTPDGPTTIDDLMAKANANLEAGKKAGVNYDPKSGKVSLPNGQSVDPASFGSAAGIASALGISQEQAQKALNESNKRTKQALAKYGDMSKYKLSFSGGGGGGGFASERSPASSGPTFNFGGLMGSRKPAQAKVAGLQKVVGGSSVGVAADNIFDMVKRRYEEKNKTDFFAK